MKRLFLLAVVFAAAMPAYAQTIKIGLVTALSGQSARAGEAITRGLQVAIDEICLLYTSPSPRDGLLSRMPSSA